MPALNGEEGSALPALEPVQKSVSHSGDSAVAVSDDEVLLSVGPCSQQITGSRAMIMTGCPKEVL